MWIGAVDNQPYIRPNLKLHLSSVPNFTLMLGLPSSINPYRYLV